MWSVIFWKTHASWPCFFLFQISTSRCIPRMRSHPTSLCGLRTHHIQFSWNQPFEVNLIFSISTSWFLLTTTTHWCGFLWQFIAIYLVILDKNLQFSLNKVLPWKLISITYSYCQQLFYLFYFTFNTFLLMSSSFSLVINWQKTVMNS